MNYDGGVRWIHRWWRNNNTEKWFGMLWEGKALRISAFYAPRYMHFSFHSHFSDLSINLINLLLATRSLFLVITPCTSSSILHFPIFILFKLITSMATTLSSYNIIKTSYNGKLLVQSNLWLHFLTKTYDFICRRQSFNFYFFS